MEAHQWGYLIGIDLHPTMFVSFDSGVGVRGLSGLAALDNLGPERFVLHLLASHNCNARAPVHLKARSPPLLLFNIKVEPGPNPQAYVETKGTFVQHGRSGKLGSRSAVIPEIVE